MKTAIGATDASSPGDWYSYDDSIGDVNMKHFSIARDLGQNGEITYIKTARQYGCDEFGLILLFYRPWTAMWVNTKNRIATTGPYFAGRILCYRRPPRRFRGLQCSFANSPRSGYRD